MKKIKKILCILHIHNWRRGRTNSLLTPYAEKCKWCGLVRVFRLWGYTYHRDAADEQ